MTKELILILGGARAGKSDFAQSLAREVGGVIFVATAEARDEDMAQRIAAHKSARPPSWETMEEPVDVAASLAPVLHDYDTVLLDCLTLWVSNLLLGGRDVPSIIESTQELLDLYASGDCTWIVVSNEVGLGVVPATSSGRTYRDALGRVNQLVAASADRVYLVVAGLAMELKQLGAQPICPSGAGGEE
jgi:adenosyl cobinamide kinase/adenosyl cobinamide phosphate guanylyltransferase